MGELSREDKDRPYGWINGTTTWWFSGVHFEDSGPIEMEGNCMDSTDEWLMSFVRVTAIVFLLTFSVLPYTYAEEDCGFDGFSAGIRKILNPNKYWDREINNLKKAIPESKASLKSAYLDMEELRDDVYVKRRIQRAILDAKSFGDDLQVARNQEIESIREDIKWAKEMILMEKEILKSYISCLKKAEAEKAKLR